MWMSVNWILDLKMKKSESFIVLKEDQEKL